MAHNPIILINNSTVVNNPRQDFFEESKNKILGRKGIILKGYMTERERIERHLKEIDKSILIIY